MKRLPESFLLGAVVSGVVYLLYDKSESSIKTVSLVLLVIVATESIGRHRELPRDIVYKNRAKLRY